MTISDASKATSIPARYLTALEESALLEVFPAPVYARFFLREYAEYLGIDDGPLLAAFDALHPPDQEPVAEEPALPRIPLLPGWRARLVVAASVMALLAVVFTNLASRGPAAPSASSPRTLTPRITEASRSELAPRLGHAPPPSRVSGVKAVLDVRARSWVEAVADGRTVLRETLPAGRSVSLRARRTLELTLGNASGVRLTVNGRLVPTEGQGRVVHLAFAWRGGRLVSA